MYKWGKDINPMFDNIYINRNILQERFFPVLNVLYKNNINQNIFILDSSDKLNIQEYQENLSNKYKYNYKSKRKSSSSKCMFMYRSI